MTVLSATDREMAFRNDLADLLAKHGAKLEITTYPKRNYGEFGIDQPIVEVTMCAILDMGNDQTAEFTEFEL